MSNSPTVISIASGKGGVGKSVSASSLAVALASNSHRVLLVDGDFGAANLHTYFGISFGAPSLSDYFLRKANFADVVLQTKYKNLWLLCGHNARFDMANINYQSKMRFLTQLSKAPVDYVIIDSGAGSSYAVIDAFLCGGIKLVLSTPSRPALENMFHFVKATAHRKIKDSLNKLDAKALLTQERELSLVLGKCTVKELVEDIFAEDAVIGRALASSLVQMNLGFIINKAKESGDYSLGAEVTKILGANFGWKIQHVATLSFDASVEDLERSCEIPTVSSNSKYSREVRNLAEIINTIQPSPLDPLSLTELD